MNIGEAAQRTGLSAKTIRYYESVDLISSERNKNGYRNFSEREVQQLLFIRRLRSLGFTLSDCQLLVPAIAKSNTAAFGSDPAGDPSSDPSGNPTGDPAPTPEGSGPATASGPTSTRLKTAASIDDKVKGLLTQKLKEVDNKLNELAALRSSIASSIEEVTNCSNGGQFIELLNRVS